MNQVTENNYNSMADDSECIEDVNIKGAMGCMVFVWVLIIAAIFFFSPIVKWLSE